VVIPCENCSNAPNNNHYWLFMKVNSEKIDGLFWCELNSISKFNNNPVIPISNLEDYQVCPICLELMEEASIISCGHTFCKVCITR
jgi:hypothetical protein